MKAGTSVPRRIVISLTVIVAAGLALTATAGDDLVAADPELDRLGLEAPLTADDSPHATKAASRVLVEATLIAQEGQTPTGAPGAISTLNSPFTDGNGKAGFTGTAGENFVWYDAGITWISSDGLPSVLTGAESTMGVGNAGEFIYSPSVDGNDAVWTHNGALLVDGQPAPGYSPPATNTFNSRPTMLPSGAAYWVAGISYSGGSSSEGRVLYTASDATPGTITPVLASDDIVGGFAIDRPSGVGFDYQISDNGSHHLHEVLLDTGSTLDDDIVYLDGAIAARETQPTGDGDNWDNFDNMTINNDGNYMFSGDTDGATTSDEFVAYNGAIVLREGDAVGGTTLATSASVNALSLNNLGQAAMIWSIGSSSAEVLFFACDASDLAGTAVELLRTGDEVDVDGNPGADATVTDFNASNTVGPGLWLAEDGRLLVEVDLLYSAAEVEAIIALELPSCTDLHLVVNEIDYDQDSTDTTEFLELYNPSASPVDLTGWTVELVNGTGGGASVYSTIALPSVALAPDDYFVVCANAATVPNCDLDVSPDTNLIQNGAPDAVGLKDPTGFLVDTVSYEGDTGAPYTEGSGAGLEDDPSIDFYSISRYPNGVDTDQNNVDLSGRCNSPGLSNLVTTSNCTEVPVELMSFSVE